jgi:hypothetical protein
MAPCSGCAASHAAELVQSDYADTFALLEQDPDAWARYQQARDDRLRTTGKSELELLHGVVDEVIDEFAMVFLDHDRQRAAHLHSVFIESEAAEATCRTFADGSGLIRVNAGLAALCEHMNTLNSAWLRSASRFLPIAVWRRKRAAERNDDRAPVDELLAAGTAALRYHLLHRRFWGNAAKVTPVDGYSLTKTTQFGVSAFKFIVAHEASHFLLAHDSETVMRAGDLAEARAVEYQADAYAFELMSRSIGDRRYGQGAALVAAQLALLIIAVNDESLYLRSPRSHPGFERRSEQLRALAGLTPAQASPGAVNPMLGGIAGMTALAADFSQPLPPSYWDALMRSSRFDTSRHRPQYFNMIRTFDSYASFSWDETYAELDRFMRAGAPDFRPGLSYLLEGEVRAALDAWGVANCDLLLDPDRTLSYRAFVRALETASIWSGSTGDFQKPGTLRLAAAALCARHVENHYRKRAMG